MDRGLRDDDRTTAGGSALMAEGALSRGLAGTGGRGKSGARTRTDGDARRGVLWHALWAPYWVASETPAPEWPWPKAGRMPARPGELGLAGDVVVRGLDQARRRLWARNALAAVVRGLWLGVAVACLWLLVELAGGPPARWAWLVGVGAVALGLGVVFALLARPTIRRTARMLDRSFTLQERLTTAVDHLGRGVPREGERASVVYLQMADAANVVVELRRNPALGVKIPVRELVLAIFWGLILAALFFLRGVGGDIPPLVAAGVPVFTPAVERTPEPAAVPAEASALAPTVEEVRQRAERANETQRDLQSLAAALQDHAVTRTAADAIGEGAYEAAADDLRELAPSADRLSPEAREELARDLQEAASRMSAGGDELSQAAQEAASGLRQGEQPAQEGVRALGDAVEETGGQIASRQELAEQMRQAEAAEERGEQGQQDQQGEQGLQGQPGQPGEPGAARPGQAGAPGEGQPAAGEPGGAGEARPGQAGQPGEGEAAPGQEGAQGGQPGGQQGQPGEGQPGGQPGGEGEQPGAPGGEASGDGERSGQGGGAGSGDSQENGGEGEPGGSGGEGQEEAGQGVPAEERVSQGDGGGVETGEPEPVTETIQLPPGGNGEGVQTSNDAGGSRAGTGAGVTAGAGTTVQGEVGETGPDSNRVPPAHRAVVERYFGEPPGPEGE